MAPKQTKNGTPLPTTKDWDKISVLYLRGDDLQSIINAFPDVHLTKGGIMAQMRKRGYTQQKKAIDAHVKKHIVDVVEQDKIKTNEQCIQLYGLGANIIEKLLKEYDAELNRGDVSKGQARATAYNLDLLMSGLTKVQKGYRVAYGMDKDGKLFEKEPEVLVIDGVNMDKI